MELTKEQTLKIYLNHYKRLSYKNKYKFTTKHKWICLGCGKTIYVSYKFKNGFTSIFCSDCFPLFYKKPTIAQIHYILKLKNDQLKIIEKQLK